MTPALPFGFFRGGSDGDGSELRKAFVTAAVVSLSYVLFLFALFIAGIWIAVRLSGVERPDNFNAWWWLIVALCGATIVLSALAVWRGIGKVAIVCGALGVGLLALLLAVSPYY